MDELYGPQCSVGYYRLALQSTKCIDAGYSD